MLKEGMRGELGESKVGGIERGMVVGGRERGDGCEIMEVKDRWGLDCDIGNYRT